MLAPFMLLQAAWVSRTALRLPPGDGPIDGVAGDGQGPPLQLLFLGESPVAGVGCRLMSEAVAARTAESLAAATGRPVHWHAAGVNGIRIRQTIEWIVPRLPERRFDLIVAVHGVNDTTGLTSVSEWRRRVSVLTDELKNRHGGRIFHAQVAPMHLFSALPQPLRAVLGLRARILDEALRTHPRCGRDFEHVAVEFPIAPEMLAEDGYHPSALGHALWGERLGAILAACSF